MTRRTAYYASQSVTVAAMQIAEKKVCASGGGHWAVQGPFAVPAAISLHASIPATTMGVAMGEQVANMLQPFWALPVVAMAGIGIQRVLGFTAVTFAIAGLIYAAGLLLLT